MVMDSALIRAAQQWVIDKYPYNSRHLLKSLEWVDTIAPDAAEAVRLAALTHDMERAFPGPDQPIAHTLGDPSYDEAHSERSARIVGIWLREQGADAALIGDVEALVRVHEAGGWPEANLVQAADSLSFLETNIGLFLSFIQSGRYSTEEVAWKLRYTYERIRVPHARDLARPMFEHAKAQLAAMTAMRVTLTVNGQECSVDVQPHHTLLEVLRDELGLTGTKECCAEGECGACTVLLNGQSVNSCLMLGLEAAGSDVLTVEGLAAHDRLDRLQEAFLDTGAVQCGFCIPGMIMSAKYLLMTNAHPTVAEIKEGLAGNLCRCAGYSRIVEAVAAAAKAEER
jgi:carbon-monoxide dehydrogenase small subunit